MRDQYFVIAIVSALVLGCQTKTELTELDRSDPQHTSTSDRKPGETESLKQNAARHSATSAQTFAVNTAATVQARTPAETCTRFLDSLRNNDAATAQSLMTSRAMALALKFKLPLDYPADSQQGFEVGESRFATKKRELAQVFTQFEGSSGGRLGWMLKKENGHWKIYGMILGDGENRPVNLMSFESPADMITIKAMISGITPGGITPGEVTSVESTPTADAEPSPDPDTPEAEMLSPVQTTDDGPAVSSEIRQLLLYLAMNRG